MKTLRLTLKHGIYWPGYVLSCFADEAETEPSDLTGWEPQTLQASRKAGGTAAFTVSVQAGPEDHQVTLLPLEGAVIAEFPAGEFTAHLVFLNDAEKPVGPFAEIIFTVQPIHYVATA